MHELKKTGLDQNQIFYVVPSIEKTYFLIIFYGLLFYLQVHAHSYTVDNGVISCFWIF